MTKLAKITWPQGYKTFFMLNSQEHEICSGHKFINANNFVRLKVKYKLHVILSKKIALFVNIFYDIFRFFFHG